MKKPKVKIEYRKVAELEKLENNPRYILEEDFERLVKSIEDLPMYMEAHAIVLSDRTGKLVIIDGNQRLEACKRLGWTEVPSVLLSGLTEKQEKEIIVRANVTNGKWDWNELANSYDAEELADWGVETEFFTGHSLGDDNDVSGGKPEKDPVHKLEVVCPDEESLQELFAELSGRGLDCKMK